MKIYRIFLASSAELAEERIAATAAIAEFSVLHPEHTIEFNTIKWENFASSYEDARKQSQYNASIPRCEVFLMLYWTKVGRFTHEEYDIAQASLQNSQKPYLLLLKKTDSTATQDSVNIFEKEVPHGNGLFNATFKDKHHLRSVILEELQKLFKDGFLKGGEPAKLLSPNGSENPTVFLGREDELRTIKERLDKCGKLMLINAEGGIGKTTLAAKYWNESLYNYKHNAWLFCENGIVNALKELAPKLNVDLAGMNEAQQVAALKHALSQVHDDFLLVLDNANDDDDIRVFRQTFEGFHWHVLITSRCQGVLEKEQELPIAHLPPPLAKALFERYYKEETQEFGSLLDQLLLAINYHTLLVEIFAKNMKESAELGINMVTFLKKLQAEGLHLGKHSFEIRTDYTGATKAKAATTDEVLDALYDFGKLTEDQRFLLLNLAFLPAEPYTLQFINSLLAKESNRTEIDLRNILKKLTKKGWVGQTQNTYRLSPVVQDLLLHKNKETLGVDAQDLLDRLNYILENDEYNLIRIKLSEAAAYVKPFEYLSKCLKLHHSEKLADYNYSAGIYFNNIGDMVSEKRSYQNYSIFYQILSHEKPRNLDYKLNYTNSLLKLGRLYRDFGDWKNELLFYKQGFTLAEGIYKSEPSRIEVINMFALSYEYLGLYYFGKFDLENALFYHKKCLELRLESIKKKRRILELINLAVSYQNIGNVFRYNGLFKYAGEYYQKFNELSIEVCNATKNLKYKERLSQSFLALGEYYEEKSEFQHALDNYLKGTKIIESICKKEPSNLPSLLILSGAYSALAGVHENMKQLSEAYECHKKSIDIAKVLTEKSPKNVSYLYVLAMKYSDFATFFSIVGNLEKVLEFDFLAYKILKNIFKNKFYANIKFITILYSYTCLDISNFVKENNLYHILEKSKIKEIRKEGYDAIKNFDDLSQIFLKGYVLDKSPQSILEELANEAWYEF